MIQLITDKTSPRLSYIADVLLKQILGLEYQISEKAKGSNAVLYYGEKAPAEAGTISIPSDKLLNETHIRKESAVLRIKNGLKLGFSDNKFEGYTFDFDLFATCFYLLTDYFNYSTPRLDEHGRYDDRENPFHCFNFHKTPLLHEYAEMLWEKLKAKYPELKREKRKFDYEITFDIDSPWYSKNKPVAIQVGGAIKNLAAANVMELSKKIGPWFGGKDVFDVYDYILQHAEPAKLKFFFLIDRHSQYDERYTHRNALYRQLINRLKNTGAGVGIHPSYKSYADEAMIFNEVRKLEEVVGTFVANSRMHFLRYKLPDTYRHLINAGIKHDYTSCPIYSVGFKHFIAVPFKWFDLEKNEETNLTIHPTMAMDRTLQLYMQLDPNLALEEIKELIDTTYENAGVFSLLLHNNTLSEWKEWKGWRMVFEETVKYLQEKS